MPEANEGRELDGEAKLPNDPNTALNTGLSGGIAARRSYSNGCEVKSQCQNPNARIPPDCVWQISLIYWDRNYFYPSP